MKKRAFSLLEVMLVVIIIGILASVGIVQYSGAVEKGRAAEAYSVLADIVGAEKAYYVENSAYTATIANLHNYDSAPVSDNFTFSVPSTDANSGYAQAARKYTTSGRLSYGMCLKSSKKASSAADAVSISCP